MQHLDKTINNGGVGRYYQQTGHGITIYWRTQTSFEGGSAKSVIGRASLRTGIIQLSEDYLTDIGKYLY